MPVYFFNQRFDDELGVDAAGLDLPNLDAARRRAVEVAREIMSDAVLGGEVVLDRSIEVTDATGRVVMSLPFTAVAKLRLPPGSPQPAVRPARGQQVRRRRGSRRPS